MPADGNCFFHAVAFAYGNDITGPRLRQILVDYMRKSDDTQNYGDFIQNSQNVVSGDVRFSKYLENLDRGAWAENIAVQATADMLNLQIRILNTITPAFIHTVSPKSGNVEKTITLGLINETHYVALEDTMAINISYMQQDKSIDSRSEEPDSKDIHSDDDVELHLSQNFEQCSLQHFDEEPDNNQPSQRMKHSITAMDPQRQNDDNGALSPEGALQNAELEEKQDQEAFDHSTNLRGLPFSTLLQEDFNLEDSISVAPGEKEHPVPFLSDANFEELAFPDKYPYGSGGLSINRENNLTTRRYFNQRLLHIDGRFAKDIDYLLAAQYAVEAKQVNDGINIALRQTRGRVSNHRHLNAGIMKNSENVSSMIRTDAAFRFMKNVRGSPSYWKTVMLDLLAMVRQLGIPTWFLTLSAADLKWPEVIQSIARQYGTHLSDEDVKSLSWEDKCKWIRTNPVTAARMFQFRLETFFKDVLLSDARPLGDLQDYMIRIEFQNRGSPHAHCLLFIKDSKQLDVDSDNEVAEFISRYQTCEIPRGDPELKELVTTLQRHIHSVTCRRNNECRFRFPHAPSPETMIARPPGDEVDPQRAILQLRHKQEVNSFIIYSKPYAF